MSLRQRYLKILAGIVPVGAAGVALLLGSTAPVAADQGAAAARAHSAAGAGVSERLAAIRAAVSDVDGPGVTAAQSRQQLAWWAWRNGGWRNGGWRNGGWRNGGWRNFWRNW
jgi:hypothetical protein